MKNLQKKYKYIFMC